MADEREFKVWASARARDEINFSDARLIDVRELFSYETRGFASRFQIRDEIGV
jgi:hypothetical protein